jgi:Leucine-rich repeat (LRR) protein
MKGIIVMEFLNNITLSGKNITLNGIPAESKALTWMLDQDVTLNATLLNSLTENTASFRVRQRYPLIALWFQQRNNEGVFQEQWYNTTGWLTDTNECNWYGINCTIMDLGGSIGMQDVVTEIDFNCDIITNEERATDDYTDDGEIQNIPMKNGSCSLGNSYIGSIPADLGLLTSLEHFDFSYNELTGTIPASVGQWTALTYFDVSRNNGLMGSLPESIGNWTDLQSFVGGASGLNGTLPESIGQWTRLEFVEVSGTALNGTLPASIGQWTALTHFYLSGVYDLAGTLPESIGQWTKLESFGVMDSFSLTGILSESIGQWTALESFILSGTNSINGTLPASIGEL